MEYKEHISVLKDEVVDAFQENLESNDCLVDLTFGAGGHTTAFANMKKPTRVISFDQDPDALKNGYAYLKENNLNQVNLVDSNFELFPSFFSENKKELEIESGVKGILMDLGVSSHHFDDRTRGFSFKGDAPLDMRMNNREGLCAKDIVNDFEQEVLTMIFKDYGEERFADRIAAEIVEKRSAAPIETTKDLENIIFHCYPKKMRFGKTNPSTRCFQALRIAVNRELDILSEIIPHLIDTLAVGGKLAIISFHSLEDRIVKHSFKAIAKNRKNVKILTKKPIIPTISEIKINPRSRSAKLRFIERILE
jgi:16S rRNA (cytosine1402-N4)-methyltransferase